MYDTGMRETCPTIFAVLVYLLIRYFESLKIKDNYLSYIWLHWLYKYMNEIKKMFPSQWTPLCIDAMHNM